MKSFYFKALSVCRKQSHTNRFRTIFSVASDAQVKKLLTFGRRECLTTASAISCFFNDETFICRDLASIFSSDTAKQLTASWTLLSSESCKQTTIKTLVNNIKQNYWSLYHVNNAWMLLVGRWEEHPDCKKSWFNISQKLTFGGNI